MKVIVTKPHPRLLPMFEAMMLPCFPKMGKLRHTFFDNRYVAWITDSDDEMVSVCTITGPATLWGTEMTLWNLCTVPHKRGKGYARRLLRSLIHHIREKEPRMLELILLVERTNASAIKLYTSLGFVRVGSTRYMGYDVERFTLRLRNDARVCIVS
jgi:ribosomal protein S18 acetylase RimI-like enzyme